MKRIIKSRSLVIPLLLIVFTVLLISFIGAIVCSRIYWGYFLCRPKLNKRLLRVEKIHSVTPVLTKQENGKSLSFKIDSNYSMDIDGTIKKCQEYPYYCLNSRSLIALKKLGFAPEEIRHMPEDKVAKLYSKLEKTKLLHKGDSKYRNAKMLSGIIIEATEKDDNYLLFIAVSGGEVSNDHYPHYEFLFAASDANHEFITLVGYNKFFYDVAGIEGFEWPYMFILLMILGFVVFIPLSIVVLIAKKTRGKKSA